MQTIDEIRERCENLKIQIKQDLTPDEIIKMQLECIQLASSLTYPIYTSRMEEFKRGARARAAYTDKFLLSEQASDRKRDAEAKADPEVRGSEALAFKAEAERRYVEDLKQDFLQLHYSLRAMLKDATEERRWSG
jgi:hypothetical protein